MTKQYLVAIIFGLIVNLGSVSHADILEYTFNGLLPSGASSHSLIADGETFTATFLIDETVPDTSSDPNIGIYSGAVISGIVEFSGGYSSPLSYSGYDVQVADDFFFPPGSQLIDAIQVASLGTGNFFQASNYANLSSVTSTSLPGPGASFTSGPDPGTFSLFQLTYSDSSGSIYYDSLTGHNVSFFANAIPEPSALGVVLGVLCLIGTRCRRRM